MRLFPHALALAVLVMLLGPRAMRAGDIYDLEVLIDYNPPAIWAGSSMVGFVYISYTTAGGQNVLLTVPVDVPDGGSLPFAAFFTPPIVVWAPGANWQVGLWIAPPNGAPIPVGVALGNVPPLADPPSAATTQTLYYGDPGCSGLFGPCTPSDVVYSGCLIGPCTLVPGSALYWTLYGYDAPIEVGTMAVYASTPEPSTVLLLATGLLAMALAMRKRNADGIRQAARRQRWLPAQR